MAAFISNNIGLILNILGTLLVAYAFGVFPKGFGGSTTSDDGKEYHFAYLVHPWFFRIGIFILLIGFLLQLEI